MQKPTGEELADLADMAVRYARGLRENVSVIVIAFPATLEDGDPIITRAFGSEQSLRDALANVTRAGDVFDHPQERH